MLEIPFSKDLEFKILSTPHRGLPVAVHILNTLLNNPVSTRA